VLFSKPRGGPALSSSGESILDNGFYLDAFYDLVFVGTFVRSAKWLRADFLQRIYVHVARFVQALREWLLLVQSGQIRHYALVILAGVVIFVGISVVRWF
jgi:NADH:ubiquinone oxidoreductase subunit 5 (subunit L)/multisubunit Na+/H+ antiporter MnhA subunit